MRMNDQHNAECDKKATELGFDLTKQFLSLAFAGIAFVVGLSFSTPGSVSSMLLWCTVIAFGLSAVLGLLFLMTGVNQLSVKKSYDIYAASLRFLSIFQILLMLGGTALLVPILQRRPNQKSGAVSNQIELKNGQQSVVYPIDPNKSHTIELENGKVKITETK
jgi:hypothetical protein